VSGAIRGRMSEPQFFDRYFDELARRLHDASREQLDALCATLVDAGARGRKIVLAGNGASASIASHVAVDLTKVCGIRAVNFNEANLFTCFSNDYGHEQWMARAISAYADPGDVAVLVSSSGQSKNVLAAARQAREGGLRVVTFSGFAPDNPLRALGDLNLWVNSQSYNVIEVTHQSWLLAAVDSIAATRQDA
jgi:D-sedoheptulose 7-phosphate isomerase